LTVATDAPPAGWNPIVAFLHWFGAALMIAMLALGWWMTHGEADAARRFDLYQTHKSLGFLALALVFARLAARRATRAPAPLLAMPPWERRAAGLAHAALYGLTLIATLSGWVVVSSAVIAIPTRFFGLFVIPDILGADPAWFAAASRLHALAAWLLASLIALHFAAAAKHAVVDRDGVMSRMALRWPGQGCSWRGRSRSNRTSPP
jgi:cytochrome b561